MKNEIRNGHRWGDWEINWANLTLNSRCSGYYILLEDMRDSAHMLDWIFQVRGKVWATPEVQADLLSALAELFDPQGTLCSCGANLYLDARAHLERVKRVGVPAFWMGAA